MTATHAEVLRALPPEILETSEIDGMTVRGAQGHRRWELALSRGESLRIALLDLPVTELEIRLLGYSEEERARFLERLEQFTRRGGG